MDLVKALSKTLNYIAHKQQSSFQHFIRTIVLDYQHNEEVAEINQFKLSMRNQTALEKVMERQQSDIRGFPQNLHTIKNDQLSVNQNQESLPKVIESFPEQMNKLNSPLLKSKYNQRDKIQTSNQFRIKDLSHRQSSHSVKKQEQIIKISLVATQQHNLRRKLANQTKIKETFDLLYHLKNREHSLRVQEWKGTYNNNKLASLTDRNVEKIVKMRKSLEKSNKSISKVDPQMVKTIQSPKRRVPYNFYNIYRMYGDDFVLKS